MGVVVCASRSAFFGDDGGAFQHQQSNGAPPDEVHRYVVVFFAFVMSRAGMLRLGFVCEDCVRVCVCVLSMLTGGARTGTGHPDITRYEWLVNHHRDSAAAYIGHAHLTLMFGVAENESAARVRYNLMQQMIAPCGREPKELRDDDDDDDE